MADDFHRMLETPAPAAAAQWSLSVAIPELRACGFTVEASDEGFETLQFADVGAFAWYLSKVPFVWPAFSISGHRNQLARLHQRVGGNAIEVRQPLFHLRARKA